MMLNGATPHREPGAPEPGLRLVFFGLSIVSDWENAAATSHRAMLRALAARGHQVIFLEERRNDPTVGLLKQRGAAPLKAFDRHFSDIPYRTYALPSRRELDVWLGREASTADAIVAFKGTPAACVEGLERLDAGHALKLIEQASSGADAGYSTELISPATEALSMPYAPVVYSTALETVTKDIDRLLVVYDDRELGLAAAAVLPDATLISAGSAAIPGFTYVPEVELGEWYRRSKVTVLVDHQDPVRALLPLSYGSASVLVAAHETPPDLWPFHTSLVEQLPLTSRRAGQSLEPMSLASELERFSADARAGDLERLVLEHQPSARSRRIGPARGC